ncbi:class A beta-lactamase-related serine hydrolase [Sphingomonas ginkgonis]|uniref:Class A beta-lactamase-related serine hydrolase n=1 Tax=Sphingomonas ginkgonis TaxID=2315330 RepID=A0A429VB12_9SPHN|nr:serine hydrolase domain-containing protein [Sphingomonas ginkgonis]RST31136.1 class A beta-lactamase-related serine hydrolase [Sphingomonas ginkgonis]
MKCTATATPAQAKQLGFHPERLDRIGAFLARRYVEPGLLPMAQLLVAREGQPVYHASLGQARADGSPLGEDAIFRIASMTKPITSIAFMQMIEEGLVTLDTPVAKVVPELAALGVYTGGGGSFPFFPTRPCAPMRMVDLLTHMSGLTYGFQNRTSVDAAYRTLLNDGDRAWGDYDRYLAALAKIPLEFEPGTAWNYSISTDLLGIIVARLSGKSLGETFQERVFAPLGMTDTFFTVPEEKLGLLCDLWTFQPGTKPKLVGRAEDGTAVRPAAFEGGGGGLFSTTSDYDRFCRMLVGGGALDGVRIVSPKTLALMTSNHLPGGADLTQMSRSLFSEAHNAGTGFGLGFGITLDPVRTLIPGSSGEYFWGGIYSTAFFVDPVERIHMVFMTQLSPSSAYPIRRELKTLIYAALTDSYA